MQLERQPRPGVLAERLAGDEARARPQPEPTVAPRHEAPRVEPVRARGEQRRRVPGLLELKRG